jgi:hypothetical protein
VKVLQNAIKDDRNSNSATKLDGEEKTKRHRDITSIDVNPYTLLGLLMIPHIIDDQLNSSYRNRLHASKIAGDLADCFLRELNYARFCSDRSRGSADLEFSEFSDEVSSAMK